MPMGERLRSYTGRHVIVDFKLDVAGIAKCAMGPELRKGVTDIAENRALPYAKSISPRSKRRSKDGRAVDSKGRPHYQDSFKVKTGNVVINQMRRVAARLWNVSPQAVVVEFGNSRNGGIGHRVLGRTINYLNGPVVGELYTDRMDRRRLQRKAAELKGLLSTSSYAGQQKATHTRTGRKRKVKNPERFRKPR